MNTPKDDLLLACALDGETCLTFFQRDWLDPDGRVLCSGLGLKASRDIDPKALALLHKVEALTDKINLLVAESPDVKLFLSELYTQGLKAGVSSGVVAPNDPAKVQESPPELISFHTWNERIRTRFTLPASKRYPRLNGIACPECGAELKDSDGAQLMSFPAKRRVQCSACTWTGHRYEQP